jgi:protein SCO1/2
MARIRRLRTGLATGLFAALLAWAGAAASAPVEIRDRTEPLPRRLEGVDVVEKLGATPPLSLGFRDQSGEPVMLSDYFDGEHPVILTLNYSNCPMLCSLQLNALVDGLKQLSWTPGDQFRIVTVSIDPTEQPETARRTQRRYLAQYGRPHAASGWSFLTGSPGNVKALTDAVGFRYGYNEARGEWVHPAAMAVLSPSGKIVRYLYGLEYPERTLRLALTEAGEGKVGTPIDRVLLFCFHYDETEGRYAPYAMNIMRLGGGLTVVVLASLLGIALHRERRRKERAARAIPAPEPAPEHAR